MGHGQTSQHISRPSRTPPARGVGYLAGGGVPMGDTWWYQVLPSSAPHETPSIIPGVCVLLLETAETDQQDNYKLGFAGREA